MNCKPNQLCRIIDGPNKNRIVETKQLCDCLEGRIETKWTVEAMQPMETGLGWVGSGTWACCHDRYLRPLGGDEKDPHDITVEEVPPKVVIPIKETV